MERRASWALALLCLSLLAGCVRPVSLEIWQESVEKYVREEGNGDPGVLRDMTWDGKERGFALIGNEWPQMSTDAHGVLLDHVMAGGRPWEVFIVGVVQKQVVEDIRLALLWTDGVEFAWQVTPEAAGELERYKAFHLKLWRERFGEREPVSPAYTSFPLERDVFRLEVAGDEVRCMHEGSGAMWAVKMPGAAK